MRAVVRLLTVLGLMLLGLVPPTAATAATTSTVLGFRLASPNTAVSPDGGMMASPGDWITVTGGGIVDLTARNVAAAGTFVHYRVDGTEHCRGTWRATALTGWVSFDGSRSARRGGVISLLVTHYCWTTGMVHHGIPMTVTSTLNAPPGSPYREGTTMGDFVVPTGGHVIIAGW